MRRQILWQSVSPDGLRDGGDQDEDIIALAPSADLLKRAKAGLPWPKYVAEYKRDVLGKLDPQKVYAELSDSILMCWEVPGENCHRRLVAEWLEKSLNIKIPEL